MFGTGNFSENPPNPPSSTPTQPPFRKIHLANLEARIWLVVDTSLGGWNERWNEGSGWSMEGTSGNSPKYWVKDVLDRNFKRKWKSIWINDLVCWCLLRGVFFFILRHGPLKNWDLRILWTFLFNKTWLFAHTFLLKGSIQSRKIQFFKTPCILKNTCPLCVKRMTYMVL